ncbi:hypothetical protein P0Y35_09610 [Kiritimatiellaeota bacterium B1221]|nr:hypothetical protein [Kiritimatiellaeota bacterium B1221]
MPTGTECIRIKDAETRSGIPTPILEQMVQDGFLHIRECAVCGQVWLNHADLFEALQSLHRASYKDNYPYFEAYIDFLDSRFSPPPN